MSKISVTVLYRDVCPVCGEVRTLLEIDLALQEIDLDDVTVVLCLSCAGELEGQLYSAVQDMLESEGYHA